MGFVKRRNVIIGTILTLLAAAVVLLILYTLSKLVDIWWYRSLGYEFYFWQRTLYSTTVFIVVTLIFTGFFFINLRLASRLLSVEATDRDPGDMSRTARAYHRFRAGSLYFSLPLALCLAIVIALPLYRNWEMFLFYIFGPAAGIQEPVFGRDVSYYLFSFPIYQLIQSRLLLCFIILFLGLALLYLIEGRLLARQNRSLPAAAKWHLSIILLVTFLIESWDLILQRNALVYKTSYAPLFYGPGFVDMKIIVPLIWMQVLFWTGSIFCLVLVIHKNRGRKVFAALLLGFLIVLGARSFDFLPRLLKKYVVEPNEFALEEPYIANNIESTLQAYRLKTVEFRNFNPQEVPVADIDPRLDDILRNIPLWEEPIMTPVLEQLQQLRRYYRFPTVTVDRYTVQDKYAQVFVAPRELDYRNLPGDVQSWTNLHLTYTHGYGATMTPANQSGGSPMVWYMQDIPIRSDYGLSVGQPRIYFGLHSTPYAIAPNDTGELDYPKGKDNVTVDYQGKGGVPVSSIFKKVVFAWYFRDRNLFLTTRLTDESKILFRRNILDRIRTITPFLALDQTPYVVANSRGIFWIQDAYTTSYWYPAATPMEMNGTHLNYVRNSIKIVVDAYNGSVDYYLYDPEDPIAKAYSRIYPGLFKDKAEMPADIRAHVRYPRDIFDIQMRIFNKYHQTDPKTFYMQEDLWAYAEVSHQNSIEPMRPYYMTLNLFQNDRLDFLQLVPTIPNGRSNLRALAAAGCDEPNYGKILVYEFPKAELVRGPAQIVATINEEPQIAQQITLWDQAGSEVVRGRIIILPVMGTIFYIQPVYLISTYQVKTPELQRVIVSGGQLAVMEKSLDEAFRKLVQLMQSEMKQVEKHFPTTPPETQQQPAGSP
ncbi:MAG: UPF0182 family protein [Desulfobacterales bacterium]